MANEVAVIGDYDIRDRKLADATSQSTINSTDAVEMKTTDGNQVFIDKASFIKAVGQAFTASDPKTFTKLLGMNGDNSPMGIGASDLASVLGVDANNWGKITHVTSSDDANNFTNGFYYWNNNGEVPQHAATSEGGFGIISFAGGNVIIQFQVGPGVYFRTKWSYMAWIDWQQLQRAT